MAKTRQVRAVGEKLDPYNLPGMTAFWISLSGNHDEAVSMPLVLPESYKKSLNLLTRLGVALYNPDNHGIPHLAAATEAETARFMLHEYASEAAAAEKGIQYANRYDTVVRLADLALSRGMPEQGPLLATVIPISEASTYSMPPLRPSPVIGPEQLATA